MGETKLLKGIAAGALIGGAVMLFDKNTRQYVMNKSKGAGVSCQNYLQQPSEAIHAVRLSYESFSKKLNKGIDDILVLLNKAEEALNKIGEMDEKVNNKLESVDNSKEAS
ncbi:YtxH domain-containing protein [Halobacillus sp. A5]|uniref:YtxH domain-containing protein n=1 Tax=Halobacillus sp. A5 TaxID=2880263 RepID=UPI0020A684AC|nr:YtxH domain-containing protein [Halobacillus sp. A5]MCP3029071.1 YtxH domain-containing protein [Halobacillus sp. A5]